MRLTAIASLVAVVLVGSASISAQQPANGWPPTASLSRNVFAPKSKPAAPHFLFPTPTPSLNQRSGARVAQKPAVVCGLTVIPGDPNVDPGIRQEVPEDGPTFSIRSVDPKVCQRP
jgi:hypothetical protein